MRMGSSEPCALVGSLCGLSYHLSSCELCEGRAAPGSVVPVAQGPATLTLG